MKNGKRAAIVDAFQSSLWFLPTLMALSAALLARVATAIDRSFLTGDTGWLYSGDVSGARELLSVASTSVTSVAGVTFSVTVVALAFASSHLGPRILRNFTADRGNQIVLGVFASTSVFCLLVLREVGNGDPDFVPRLGVTTGVLLTVLSVFFLVYFIHHVSVVMQVDYLLSSVAKDLRAAISELYPEDVGVEPPEGRTKAFEKLVADLEERPSRAIDSWDAGYVQGIDTERLMKVAVRNGTVIRLLVRPGSFLFKGTPLAEYWGPQALSEEDCRSIRGAFIIGGSRTAEQDVEFAVEQLVEVAMRALSPGVNEPFTAIRCIDQLGNALLEYMRRPMPSRYRLDEAGELRMIVRRTDFGGLADAAFDQVRQSSARSPAVLLRLLELIVSLLAKAETDEHRNILERHRDMVAAAGKRVFDEPRDRADVDKRMRP